MHSPPPIQLNVDIHGGEGVTDSGLPWHDDLYLEVLAAGRAAGRNLRTAPGGAGVSGGA